jgi:hypothetical protein
LTIRLIQKIYINISFFVMAYSIIRNTLILTYLFSIYTKKLNKMNGKIRNIKVKNITYFRTEETSAKEM